MRQQHDLLVSEEGYMPLTMWRERCKAVFHNTLFQLAVGLLIVLAFCLDLAEAQLLPAPGSGLERVFVVLDAITTGLFTVELAMNAFAHSKNRFKEFLSRPSNWFDTAIVVQSLVTVCLLAAGVISAPSAKMLRLMRLGRVVRLFRSLESLQKLINAITSSILPVCNAFLILVIVAAVYAVLGTQLFRHRAPKYFGDFLTSLFTMFQILSGDSWASAVARSFSSPPSHSPLPPISLF